MGDDSPATPTTTTMTTKKASSSSGPSILNILMLYLTLLGLGAIGGYGAFYVMFNDRCSTLMKETEERHRASREELRNKYEVALEGQQQCLSDTSMKNELHELQGRLEAQKTLADRHQKLLDKQEETLTRLSKLQQAHEQATESVATLREELTTVKQEYEQHQRKTKDTIAQKDLAEASLTARLGEAERVKGEQEEELELYNMHLEKCGIRMPIYEEELNHIKTYLRNQNHQRCKMDHGKGPFMVEFTLQFPLTMGVDESLPTSFTVELAPLTEMPHTVHTFLDLVDLQLFDGTSFVAANSMQIEGGHPNHAEVNRSVKLHERYAKFGYNRTPLGFNEYSERFPHEAFTIAFAGKPHAGPTLIINMVDNIEKRGPGPNGEAAEPCFGKVINGFDTLNRILTAPKSVDGYRFAKNVVIQTARKVRKPIATSAKPKKEVPKQQQQEQKQQQESTEQTADATPKQPQESSGGAESQG